MTEESNPYAAPKADTLPAGRAEAHAIRMAHLRTESNVKALGVFCLSGSLTSSALVWAEARLLEREFGTWHLSWTCWALALPLSSGIGLLNLQRWAWALAAVYFGISAIMSLFEMPGGVVSLVVQALVLRFLLLTRTRRVMAQDYSEIVMSTSKCRSHVARWGWWVVGICGFEMVLIVWTWPS